uniref:Uncharacterized protein n=1 Tax=Romanomermis culicivorax TaxID=13658 RepID=A0A915JLQ8_ROMCU
MAAPRKFVDCRSGACADAEVLDGCRTANDLKHTLYNARDHVRNYRNDCHNVRIVSHGGAVASRVRKN